MVDLVVYKGDSKDYVFTVKDEDDAVINITGYTFYFTVKAAVTDDDDDAEITKTVTTHTSPTAGITTISLSSSDTDALSVTNSTTRHVYDVRMKDTSSKVTTLMSGEFKVLRPVLASTS